MRALILSFASCVLLTWSALALMSWFCFADFRSVSAALTGANFSFHFEPVASMLNEASDSEHCFGIVEVRNYGYAPVEVQGVLQSCDVSLLGTQLPVQVDVASSVRLPVAYLPSSTARHLAIYVNGTTHHLMIPAAYSEGTPIEAPSEQAQGNSTNSSGDASAPSTEARPSRSVLEN